MSLYLRDPLKIYILSNFLFLISFDNLKKPEIPSLVEFKLSISSKNLSALNNSEDLDVFFANKEIFTLFFSAKAFR